MLGRDRPGTGLRISSRARLDLTLLGVAALAAIAALTRQAGVARYRAVWAEDGALFGQCPLVDPFPPACIVAPYDGWLHLVPRTLGWAAASMPLEWFSYSVAGLAALTVAVCAAVVARAVAQAGGSVLAGAIAGAGLVLVYPAGAEVIGNITNIEWVLFLSATILAACTLVGRPLDRLDVAFLLVTLASTPFGLLLVAILALDHALSRHADPSRRRLLVAACLIVAVQLVAAMTSPRNEIPDLPVTLLSPVAWLIDLLLVRGPFGGRGVVPGWLPGVLTLVVIAVAVAQAFRGRSDPSPALAGRPWWAPVLGLAVIVVACAAVFAASTYLNRHDTARYDYVPAAGMVVVLAVAVSLTRARVWRSASGWQLSLRTGLLTVAALVLLAGGASTFRVSNGGSAGPSYPAELREARLACARGASTASVQIAPIPRGSVTFVWRMNLPCARLRG